MGFAQRSVAVNDELVFLQLCSAALPESAHDISTSVEPYISYRGTVGQACRVDKFT